MPPKKQDQKTEPAVKPDPTLGPFGLVRELQQTGSSMQDLFLTLNQHLVALSNAATRETGAKVEAEKAAKEGRKDVAANYQSSQKRLTEERERLAHHTITVIDHLQDQVDRLLAVIKSL